MKQGNIGVTSENIFPVIKKFLYSDHEIFLRELVSNAVDACQKLKTLSSVGDFKGELGDLKVSVSIDKDNGTITVSDNGIGMSAEEIDKYINQIAFSGASEFLDKYKNDANAIIGHFGLGFYSAFMVSKKVEIFTKSYKEDAPAVHWSCEGETNYELEDCDKAERGTSIVLHIDDDSKEFLSESKISELLNKYCKFLSIPVAFGKKKEYKDGKQVETEEDNIINNTTPAWTRKPSELTEEDYESFYRELFPYNEAPLFHIHLNVDYPFKLTGILYFPKVTNSIELQRNKIQLYCNQVFVTDSVEGIVPEFLTLLHGVIDSPDIPLNVSRSYLQSDSNVKKISNHISKKVADSLSDIFKNKRSEFEEKWDFVKIFISYGMLTDDKFYDRATEFNLFKNTDGNYYTFDEYKKLIEANQTDKDGNLVMLYTNDPEQQYSYIEAAKNKGYDVLLFDGQLDIHLASRIEQKDQKHRFVRVDSDIVERLIPKENQSSAELSEEDRNNLSEVFSSQCPKSEKADYIVTFESLGADNMPVMITQNEFMRRMKEMSAAQGGMMSFYGSMPDSYNLVVNTDHELVKAILTKQQNDCATQLESINKEIAELKGKIADINEANKDKNDADIPEAEKQVRNELNSELGSKEADKRKVLDDFAAGYDTIRHLIDLALLSNNMLKGEALSKFVKRSTEFIKA